MEAADCFVTIRSTQIKLNWAVIVQFNAFLLWPFSFLHFLSPRLHRESVYGLFYYTASKRNAKLSAKHFDSILHSDYNISYIGSELRFSRKSWKPGRFVWLERDVFSIIDIQGSHCNLPEWCCQSVDNVSLWSSPGLNLLVGICGWLAEAFHTWITVQQHSQIYFSCKHMTKMKYSGPFP